MNIAKENRRLHKIFFFFINIQCEENKSILHSSHSFLSVPSSISFFYSFPWKCKQLHLQEHLPDHTQQDIWVYTYYVYCIWTKCTPSLISFLRKFILKNKKKMCVSKNKRRKTKAFNILYVDHVCYICVSHIRD